MYKRQDKKAVFRSTLFPASRPLVRGSNLEELITEIVYYLSLIHIYQPQIVQQVFGCIFQHIFIHTSASRRFLAETV